MDTTDTESVEDESEYPQQPYVDIEAVNSTLTEVHQQYNNLLLKYSNALNIIDELKCQLACGIGQGIAGARVESYALGLRRDVHFLENDVRKREPFAPAADKRNSDLVTSRQSGGNSPRRAILCASDVGRVLTLDNIQLSAAGESTVEPKNNARESAREIEALGKPTSSCMGVILDPMNEFVSYTASMEEMPKPSSPPCAYDSSRRGHSSQKKTAAVQPKYHQVAVVYPAQRSAELCTVGCCIAHSCCCCQHTAEHQKSIHHMEAPHSSCCFSAGLDAKLTHLSRKCLCSGTSATPDTALFKVSSALDIALKLATELRKSSSSLLQQL
uniref:Uncharacterized protein n=1 Tax=Rhipicephalus appendiculatus TaxID=34631 RepID=A0A131Z709_RHIAP